LDYIIYRKDLLMPGKARNIIYVCFFQGYLVSENKCRASNKIDKKRKEKKGEEYQGGRKPTVSLLYTIRYAVV
jgi:hypothetical protein